MWVFFFLSFVYMYFRWISSFQDGRIGFPLIRSAPPHFLCLFQTKAMISNVIFFFNGWRWEEIVCFVDTCRIIDHYNLNFLFLKYVFLGRFRKTILSVLIDWFVCESDILSSLFDYWFSFCFISNVFYNMVYLYITYIQNCVTSMWIKTLSLYRYSGIGDQSRFRLPVSVLSPL